MMMEMFCICVNMIATSQPHTAIELWNVATVTEELNFYFKLNLNVVNSMWLETTILNSVVKSEEGNR